LHNKTKRMNIFANKYSLNALSKLLIVIVMLLLFEQIPITNSIYHNSIFVIPIIIDSQSTEESTDKYCKKQQQQQQYYYCKSYNDNKKITLYSLLHIDFSYNNIIYNWEALNLPLSSYTSFNSSSSKIKKLVHSSIRIEEEVFNSLQKEAERQGISFNNLVNKTLKTYVTSEMYFEQLGFLLVSKDFLRKIFTELNDEKRIEELGKELGLTVAKEYVTYFFPKVDSCTLPPFLDIWFRRFQSYNHRIEIIHDTNNIDINLTIPDNNNKTVVETKEEHSLKRQIEEVHYFTLNHDINTNFSIALKSVLEGLIEPIIKSPVTFKDITANSIAFLFSIFSLTNQK